MKPELARSTLLMASPLLAKAVSSTAEFVEAESSQSFFHMQESVYFGLRASGVMDELCDIFEQCRESNWDGYGAEPIAVETYRYAYRFLESLPWGITKPTVGAEPDGHLTLEWHRSQRRTLSVSISPDGDLHYAALLGGSKAYGSEPFFGDMPQAIFDLINRVCAA